MITFRMILLVGLFGSYAFFSVLADELNVDHRSAADVHVSPVQMWSETEIPIGLRFSMIEGWHTYAENPGDSGMPPEIVLAAPEGVSLGRWQFPPAKRFADAAGVTYGYDDQVVLTNTLRLSQSLDRSKPLEIVFHVDWMVCNDACIPLQTTLRLRIEDPPATESDALAQWKRLLVNGGWPENVFRERGKMKIDEKEDEK